MASGMRQVCLPGAVERVGQDNAQPEVINPPLNDIGDQVGLCVYLGHVRTERSTRTL